MPSNSPRIEFRVTPEQHAELEAAATKEGYPVPVWVRAVALREVAKRQRAEDERLNEHYADPENQRPAGPGRRRRPLDAHGVQVDPGKVTPGHSDQREVQTDFKGGKR